MRIPSQTASQKMALVPRRPQRQRGRDRVAALLAAGATVFAEKGYDAATMTEIAARAGASIGSLYQFFPTKELLAEALHAANGEALAQMLDALTQETRKPDKTAPNQAGPSAAVLADRLFDGLTTFLADHPSFVVLAERRDPDSTRKRELRQRLRGQITAFLAQAEPPVPPQRAEVMAVVILHLLKAAVIVSGETDLAIGRTVVDEMRAMLRNHLSEG